MTRLKVLTGLTVVTMAITLLVLTPTSFGQSNGCVTFLVSQGSRLEGGRVTINRVVGDMVEVTVCQAGEAQPSQSPAAQRRAWRRLRRETRQPAPAPAPVHVPEPKRDNSDADDRRMSNPGKP